MAVSCTLCLLWFLVGGKVLIQGAGLFHNDYKSDVPFTVLIVVWSFFLIRLQTHPADARGYVLKKEWLKFLLFSALLGVVFAISSLVIGS
jgi:hypothetical protein